MEIGTAIARINIRAFPTGVSATGSIGTVTLSTQQILSVLGVSAAATAGSVVVIGKANVPVIGVFATGSVGAVALSTQVRLTLTGVSATGYVGSPTIVTTAFNYAAVAGLYDRARTVYIDKKLHRTVYINSKPDTTVYILRRLTSQERTVHVL
jgi:hypothetical protein